MKIIIASALAVLLAMPATAQNNCAARPVVVQRLQDVYGETRQTIGMDERGTVLEWWGSVESGTWTITITMPDGMTCLANSGNGFSILAEALPPQGDPT